MHGVSGGGWKWMEVELVLPGTDHPLAGGIVARGEKRFPRKAYRPVRRRSSPLSSLKALGYAAFLSTVIIRGVTV
jgi:hypothetical protein